MKFECGRLVLPDRSGSRRGELVEIARDADQFPNQPITPDELHEALGPDTVNELSQQTGVPRNDLLSQLAQALPTLVDRFTPQGRIPNPDGMDRLQPGGAG